MYRDPDLYGKCLLAEAYFAGQTKRNACRDHCLKDGDSWLGRGCKYWKPLEEEK